MKTKIRLSVLFWLGLGVLAVGRIGLGLRHPAFPPDPPIFNRVSSFHLTDQNRKTFTDRNLSGKIWIANFIFTHCAGPCPLVSGEVKKLAGIFQGEPGVRFVSFSVDPERDTPEVMRAYAQKFDADPERWSFLTGPREVIDRLAQDHFRLGVMQIPEAERESVDQTVSHSTKLALVDRSGRIRGYYDAQDRTGFEKLVNDVQSLLKE